MKRKLTSYELVIFTYIFAMSAIAVAGRAKHWPIYLAYHAGMIGVLSGIAYADNRFQRPFWRFIRTWFPLFVVLASFRELHYLVPEVHSFDDRASDAALMEMDRRWFGDVYAKVSRLWWPPFVEFLHYCYWTYFPMPIALMVLLYARKRWMDLRLGGAVLLLTFYTGYLLYVVVPAVGPHHFEPRAKALDGLWLGGLMHRTVLAVEWTMPDAYPSLHTATSVVTLMLAWRLSRRLFWIILIPAIGLILATFILRYHYLVDVLAGVALAPIVYAMGVTLHRWWDAAPDVEPGR